MKVKAICEKFKRCACGRCTDLPEWQAKENGCEVCLFDNQLYLPCEKATEFVRKGHLYEFDRHG